MLFAVEKTFADALAQALARSKMSAYRLAEESGVQRSGISLYLSGKRLPDEASIAAIARALGVPDDELQALADVQRIGADRLVRIGKQVPEIFGVSSAPPMTEAAIVAELRRRTGGDLASIQLGPDDHIWALQPEDRHQELWDTLVDLMSEDAAAEDEEAG